MISIIRLEQTYMEDGMILDLGRQLHLVSLCPHLFKDGERSLVSQNETLDPTG